MTLLRLPAYPVLAECAPAPGTTASLSARLSLKSFSLLVYSLKIPYRVFFYIGNHVVCEKAAALLHANLYAFYMFFFLHSLARPSVQEQGWGTSLPGVLVTGEGPQSPTTETPSAVGFSIDVLYQMWGSFCS